MKTKRWISSIKTVWSYWAIRFVAVWCAPYVQPRSLRPSNLRLLLSGLALTILVFAASPSASALPLDGESKATIEIKQMVGEVSMVRSNYLSIIVYPDGETETEMIFLLENELEMSFKDSLEKLKMGDRISVTVEERTWQVEGYDLVRTKRVAKAVKLLRPAVTGLRSEE